MRKRTILVAAFASAIALIFAGPASADVGRIVGPVSYNFPAVGQGDVGGVCFFQSETSSIPPELWSCIEAAPVAGETHVDVTVTDNSGNPVYISIQQDDNPNFAAGCGTITGFPINSTGPGGADAPPVTVFPWPGPGVNVDFAAPGVDPCVPGTVDTTGGSGTFTFHTH